MKALLATLSFTTFILLIACNTASDTSSSGDTNGSANGAANTDNTGGSGSGGSDSGAPFDAGLSSTSKFDIMVAGYVKADGSALQSDRQAIATDADSAAVLETVTLDVWLKSSSTDYATYFKSDGSMQEKTPGNPYIAQWYLFEEGKVGTALGLLTTQSRFDRVHAGFASGSFADGAKKATLLLRVYEPGTSDMGADKAGAQGWQFTFSKSTETLDFSGISILITNATDASVINDLNLASLDYSNSLSDPISSTNETYLTTIGETLKPHVAIKNFQLDGAKAAEFFIAQLTGTSGTSAYSQTTVNPALDEHNVIIKATPYTNTVRVDFLAEPGKRGKVIVTIADKKHGLTQDVVLELAHNVR